MHLLETVVVPEGQLIVYSQGSARRSSLPVQDIPTILGGFGCSVAGTASTAAPNRVTGVVVAWMDAASIRVYRCLSETLTGSSLLV